MASSATSLSTNNTIKNILTTRQRNLGTLLSISTKIESVGSNIISSFLSSISTNHKIKKETTLLQACIEIASDSTLTFEQRAALHSHANMLRTGLEDDAQKPTADLLYRQFETALNAHILNEHLDDAQTSDTNSPDALPKAMMGDGDDIELVIPTPFKSNSGPTPDASPKAIATTSSMDSNPIYPDSIELDFPSSFKPAGSTQKTETQENELDKRLHIAILPTIYDFQRYPKELDSLITEWDAKYSLKLTPEERTALTSDLRAFDSSLNSFYSNLTVREFLESKLPEKMKLFADAQNGSAEKSLAPPKKPEAPSFSPRTLQFFENNYRGLLGKTRFDWLTNLTGDDTALQDEFLRRCFSFVNEGTLTGDDLKQFVKNVNYFSDRLLAKLSEKSSSANYRRDYFQERNLDNQMAAFKQEHIKFMEQNPQ